MSKTDERSKAMTIREFLELGNETIEVYLFNFFDDSEITTTVDDMDGIGDDVLDSEVLSWDYYITYDEKGYEKAGTKFCLNYYCER